MKKGILIGMLALLSLAGYAQASDCKVPFKGTCLFYDEDHEAAIFVTFRVFAGSYSMAKGELDGWVVNIYGDDDSGFSYDIISTQGMMFYGVNRRFILAHSYQYPG